MFLTAGPPGSIFGGPMRVLAQCIAYLWLYGNCLDAMSHWDAQWLVLL